MKFNVSSKTLYSYVSAVSKVINSKNALTVLNNFLFELNDNLLTITASDLENTLVASLTVMDGEGSGKFCIDARRIPPMRIPMTKARSRSITPPTS